MSALGTDKHKSELKICVTMVEHIFRHHPQFKRHVWLWYRLKAVTREKGIRDGRVFIKDIPGYGKAGLVGFLKTENPFWRYKHISYRRFDERFVLLNSFVTVLRFFGITSVNSHKWLYFRVDADKFLSSPKLFGALVVKSMAEFPFKQKSKWKNIGRTVAKIGERSGYSERNAFRGLKLAGANHEQQMKQVYRDDGKHAVHATYEEANLVENYDAIQHREQYGGKLILKKGHQGVYRWMVQQPNKYHFTGRARFWALNPA